MPTDKIKPPHKFPVLFNTPFELGIGKWELYSGTKIICLGKARKFRAFIKSIKAYPMHEYNQMLEEFDFGTRIELQYDLRAKSLKLRGPTFALFVIVKNKIDLLSALTPP